MNRTAHMVESARPAGASDEQTRGSLIRLSFTTSQPYTVPKPTSSRHRISTRFSKPGEYVVRKGNFGSDGTSSLVDQLIVGLASERTRERLLVEGLVLTFDKPIQVIENISQVHDLLQQYRVTKEDVVQVIDGTQHRPTRLSRREFCPTISRRNRSASPSRPGIRVPRTSARRSPRVCGRFARMWHHFEQCPALGKTCFRCAKIRRFRNACRTPRSATTHPSSPRVKRHTRAPLQNIEIPPDDDKAIVVNQLGQHETS
ncbi:hypothetical protein HPB48_000468 [Haemaphysalis longicornis]|uniref:Uncharacterized protein n=1 Tax=Haemaphysalis longicornis TaxID=44386 RepID=A0A9J6F949_HAELO|nr:hypothetical protein HPB48_000468 [Haemaphysalis longicornis]